MAGFARKVGFRYLRAKKRSSFLSLITAISIGGVAVGVLTLIVTLSVMSGFEGELKKRLFSAETHVLVESLDGYFKRDTDLVAKIQTASPDVVDVYEVLQTEVILRSGRKVSGALFKGVGPEQLTWVKEHLSERAPPEFLKDSVESERVILGQEMAFNMGVVAGDKVTMVSPVESEGPLGAVPRVKQFVVEGIYKTGVPEQELHVVFTPIAGVESFLKQAGVLSQIEVRLSSLENAQEASDRIMRKLGIEINDPLAKWSVRSWQKLNEHLFQSLKLERVAMFCILVFIVIVASFNIISTLTMMVIEKKRSLSILRAIGATPKQIGNIFVWEGAAIGLVGIGSGTTIALVLCYFLKKYPVIELPDFYYDRSLPVVVDPMTVGLIIIVAMIIVYVGSIVPSKKASELTPMEGIRDAR